MRQTRSGFQKIRSQFNVLTDIFRRNYISGPQASKRIPSADNAPPSEPRTPLNISASPITSNTSEAVLPNASNNDDPDTALKTTANVSETADADRTPPH